MSYSDYLKSEHWQKVKKSIYRKNKACRICKKEEDLNIHHKTYNNLYHETKKDLVVLCRECHKMWHDNFKFKRLSNANIKRICMAIKAGFNKEIAISKGSTINGLRKLGVYRKQDFKPLTPSKKKYLEKIRSKKVLHFKSCPVV